MAGSDASIYSLIRPQEKSTGPLDQYAQAMTMKNLMGQGELHDIQRRGLLRDEQTGEQLRGLFGRNASPTDAEVMAIDPLKAGPAYLKQKREGVKADADLQKVDLGNFIDLAAQSLKERQTIRTPEEWAAHRDRIIQVAGMFKTPEVRAAAMKSAEALPVQLDPQYIARSIVEGKELFTPKPVERTDGQKKWMEDTNPFTNPGILTRAPTQMQQTPESVASVGATIRGQNMTDARARETAERDRFGPPQEVTGPDGKPRLVIQNKNNGSFVDANTQQPVAGIGPKVGETAQKQQIGVQNTRSAISEYRDALNKFGPTDIARPDARARMGTVYNNMLLQAKEAFNLGVLNGPDYMILQEVITNPASMTGAITSKKALDDQAKKLEEIMGRIGTQITATQSGNQVPQTPQQSGGRIKFLGFE